MGNRWWTAVLTAVIAMTMIDAKAQAVGVETGVSQELAKYRAEHVSDVRYQLWMALSQEPKVTCQEAVSFLWTGRDDLQLDFQGSFDGIAVVNGKRRQVEMRNEHIIIPAKLLQRGKVNTVELTVRSRSKSLNHHGDYLYTLFVPDHARSVFACFDQPDLKARFTLSLAMPADWQAISNGEVVAEDTIKTSSPRTKTIRFAETDLLPTYLFSFTAGQFQRQTATRNGYEMEVLYRETDTAKVAQLPTVFDEVALSLRWLEEYTGIQQPFRKYGFVVLPGYQFGGMEHPGAIQLNDRTVFLGPHPTPDEELKRLQLIAHETAHLWFGDLVTMRWFDDVWTKEVFANFMADKIAREQFPDINHDLNFLKTHYILAYATDRTDGTHPIQQPLRNLNQAGLLYGNIIYHKAPIMMCKLEEQMGKDSMQQGLRNYLSRYAYANATWDDLIGILDSEAPQAGLKAFDREWVKSKGMKTVSVDLAHGLPNLDGMGYARYRLADGTTLAQYTERWNELESEQSRFAAMMTVYENYLMGTVSGEDALSVMVSILQQYDNEQMLSAACSYAFDIVRGLTSEARQQAEEQLYTISRSHPQTSIRQKATRLLSQCCLSAAIVDSTMQQWKEQQAPLLNERDYMQTAYHLAILQPAQWQEILSEQRRRLTSDDRQREFDYVSRACTPDTAEQHRLFLALIKKENRTAEPWAENLLTLLCDETREQQATTYITPGLSALEEIQQTSDIFFPGYWLHALLGSRRSEAARQQVVQFINEHPDYPPALMNKLKEHAYRILHHRQTQN